MHQISDWDDAYANGPHIAGGDEYPAMWAMKARTFRDEMVRDGRAEIGIAYGPAERNRIDFFHPKEKPVGMMVFIHGGYWMAFDNSSWSHCARGALELGYSVAMPTYTLCPHIRISGITEEVGQAVNFAATKIKGPLRLTGHSAGGHLVTRLVCMNTPLEDEIIERIERVVSISGIHDLRPMMHTQRNRELRIDRREARHCWSPFPEPSSCAGSAEENARSFDARTICLPTYGKVLALPLPVSRSRTVITSTSLMVWKMPHTR